MEISPLRPRLYRTRWWAVICLSLVLCAAQGLFAQVTRGDTKSKGPRATALLQLPEKGNARLIPVCIMIDGKFFDAGIYKADPVPMALEGGTVYEAQQTGKPIGLFTVKNVLQQQQTKAWLAEGDWEAAGAAPKKPTALQAESKPREEEDRPPTLRRPAKASAEGKPSETKPTESKPPEAKSPAASAPASGTTSSPPASTPNPPSGSASAPGQTTPTSTASSTSTSATTTVEEPDPNAPHLQRGIPRKPPPTATPSRKAAPATSQKSPATANSSKPALPATPPSAKAAVRLIPAISDADGPEPRPYTIDLKPEEEQAFRKKMLALAGTEIATYTKQFESGQETPRPSKRGTKAATKPAPAFEDAILHVFDIATNNEPIIVLTAKAKGPDEPNSTSAHEYYVTLVARADYNNELRKLFSAVTDDRHLDVTPRMDLIDAVDADGDGRAELLFRENSDAGNAFVVYRVTPDRLWALFEGTPQ